MNTYKRPTVPCRYCGVPTPMTGTKLCDPCWEVARAVESNPRLARRVLAEMEVDNPKVAGASEPGP